jgi:NRPS condensation-like uncharacterized protein
VWSAWIERDDLGALRTYARTRSATLNDVLLAGFFRAFARVMPATPGAVPVIDVPADLRKHLSPATRVGLANFAGLLRCVLPDGVPGSYGETLARVHAAMDAAKKTRAEFGVVTPLVTFRRWIAYRDLGERIRTHMKPFAPVWSNLGVLDAAPLDAVGVRQARFFGSVSLRGPASVMASAVGGRLHLASSAVVSGRDREQLAALVAELRAELVGVARSVAVGRDSVRADSGERGKRTESLSGRSEA